MLLTLGLNSGCATLFGTARPVEEKSTDYRITDLTRLSADWEKEGPPEKTPGPVQGVSDPGAESALADRAWHSTKTGSIITLNSICRPSHGGLPADSETLRELSKTLFLGLGDIQQIEEKERVIQGVKALERTVQGKMMDTDGKSRTAKLRTVTVLHDECLFDLMLASAPSKFSQDEEAFSRLVESLRFEGSVEGSTH